MINISLNSSRYIKIIETLLRINMTSCTIDYNTIRNYLVNSLIPYIQNLPVLKRYKLKTVDDFVKVRNEEAASVRFGFMCLQNVDEKELVDLKKFKRGHLLKMSECIALREIFEHDSKIHNIVAKKFLNYENEQTKFRIILNLKSFYKLYMYMSNLNSPIGPYFSRKIYSIRSQLKTFGNDVWFFEKVSENKIKFFVDNEIGEVIYSEDTHFKNFNILFKENDELPNVDALCDMVDDFEMDCKKEPDIHLYNSEDELMELEIGDNENYNRIDYFINYDNFVNMMIAAAEHFKIKTNVDVLKALKQTK